MEPKRCPWCGMRPITEPFMHRVVEVPRPIKLFGRWSLIKMKYKEIPVKYTTECSEWCDGFSDYASGYFGDTPEESLAQWNERVEGDFYQPIQ